MGAMNRGVLAHEGKSRTKAPEDKTYTNTEHNGVEVFVKISALSNAPAITVSIDVEDPASHEFVPILTSAPLTAVTNTPFRMVVHPNIQNPITNQRTCDVLQGGFRVHITHANTDPITYSVGVKQLV